MDAKKQNLEVAEITSLTPSTVKLHQLRSGKGPGMLTEHEVELLRKSKKEISEICQIIYQSKN